MRFLALIPLVLAVAVVPGSTAAIRVGGTDCSVDFGARNANLDCALGIPGGTLTLGGSLAITAHVRGGERAAFTYDSLGRLVAADVGAKRISYTYGDDGRLTAAAGSGGTVVFTYDSLGRLVGAGDARFQYGEFGLVRAVDGTTVDYTYDPVGNLITADAGTSTGRFAYDAHGHVTRAEVDGSTTEYQYDDSRPVLRITDGQTTHYSYDSRGRLLRSGGSDPVAYSYDTDGSLLAVSDSAGVTRFTYDRGGRLTRITEPDGTAAAFTYNAAGLLSQVAPEIGDEVIVAFLEGDPDQPIVTGAVYSGDRGETFALNLRGRLSTCSTCP